MLIYEKYRRLKNILKSANLQAKWKANDKCLKNAPVKRNKEMKKIINKETVHEDRK